MDTNQFDQFLLKTAFSCIACDGHIDRREVSLLRQLGNEENLFGDILLDEELDKLVREINQKGQDFLRDFLSELKNADLNESQELSVVKTAIRTINADDKLEYSEVKFFKIIRSKLKVSNGKILTVMPDIEDYLEQDIVTESLIDRLKEQFFGSQALPKFDMVHRFDEGELEV